MLKKLITSIALVAILASLTTLGFAQGTESAVKGNLGGTVTDPSGAVVQGAKVDLSGPTGDRTANTDAEGRFLFQVLIPGMYSVKISKDGFKTAEVKSAEVQTGRTSAVAVKLELGTSATTVEVSAAAIAVDTTSTAVASNLTDSFYESVPVGRGVTGLFYAAPGVTSGGGTGTANPSIAGGTGLENNYVADGVSITDGGFGGIGVYSRIYGSLSTGINLSFVKEVQVKTGGFEAQYGKSTGGIVQIVTKSGTNKLHGQIAGFLAPQQLEKTRLQVDDYAQGGSQERFNLQGKILHQSNYDANVELGGNVPGLKNHLFFFGSFNPQWNTDYNQFAQYRNPSDTGTAGSIPGGTQTRLGNYSIPVKVYSYAGKLTWRVNDHHQLEGSFFGDPTYGDQNANGNTGPQTASKTTFDKLQYGTRNVSVHYNGTFSPTWLANASWSWGHNNLTDTPNAKSVFGVLDYTQRTPCSSPFFNPDCTAPTNPLRGQFERQGLGYFENTTGDNYGLNFDTSKTFAAWGEHNVTVGYRYDRGHYDGTKARTGGYIPVDSALAGAVTGDPNLQALLVARGTNAAFQLRARGGSSCIGGAFAAEIYVPGLSNCADGGEGVSLRQTRGEFGAPAFKTTSLYHTVFVQDNWSPSKYVTFNAGLRWEQQHVEGVNAKYTFTDNWSPRIGISVDPWGNRKSKVYANFGRYTEALPLDIAIRSLSQEFDFADTNWVPPTDGAGHALISADGTMPLSASTLLGTTTPQANGGFIRSFNSAASLQAGEAFGRGTKSQYLDEYVVGFEHEFGNSGVVFSTRYVDRRIKRIIEDNAALSPEAAQGAAFAPAGQGGPCDPNLNPIGCSLSQIYFISNVNKKQDLFHNPQQLDYLAANGVPAACASTGTNLTLFSTPTDSNGNGVLVNGNDSMCVPNALDVNGNQLTATPGADGIPDGFVDPNRVYKAVEFEVNKAFSRGWQMRANYRIAKLTGNYEGNFRNDNGQNDPNISSLFDFTRGDFNLLGQQFVPGVLNTDVRHLVNGYVSYTLSGNHANGLTLGSAVHFQTGIPINNLFAHPVYANAGEIPFCADNTVNCPSARGSLGRTNDWGSVDFHSDYPIRITEGSRLKLGVDLFNITNNRTQLRVDQFAQRTVGVPNSDFQKPTGVGPSAVNGNTNPGYQRPFNARFSVRYEF